MHHEGHGDVVGDGERMVYIARERQNHFVPLIPRPSRTTSASGSQSGRQWRTVSDAISSTASGSVAVPAGGAPENSKSAKSSAPGFIICNDIIEDTIIEDSHVAALVWEIQNLVMNNFTMRHVSVPQKRNTF